MFKHLVEIDGRYYIKQWGIVRMEYLSIHIDHWFGRDYIEMASSFSSREDAITAFNNYNSKKKSVQKFSGGL